MANEPQPAPAANPPVPTGPRSSLNVSADRSGNIWLYAPTQPGGMILLGTLAGPLPVDAEAQETAAKELADLKKENSNLKSQVKKLQEEIDELEEPHKPSKKR